MGNGQSVEKEEHAKVAEEPMPEGRELEEQFAQTLQELNMHKTEMDKMMEMPPEKKWKVVLDTRKSRSKNPPDHYTRALKGQVDPKVLRKRRAAKKLPKELLPSDALLTELEISLRTNTLSWVKEFVEPPNNGYLLIAQFLEALQQLHPLHSSAPKNTKNPKNPKDDRKNQTPAHSRDISSSSSSIGAGITPPSPHPKLESSPSQGSLASTSTAATSATTATTATAATAAHHDKSPVHLVEKDITLCILCIKSLMNNSFGFQHVMEQEASVDLITSCLSVPHHRTVIASLELLSALCVVGGVEGHRRTLVSLDHYMELHQEARRFETLVDKLSDSSINIDLRATILSFINVLIHAPSEMNFRVFLQYEFTLLGIENVLRRVSQEGIEKINTQIEAYRENFINVNVLLSYAQEADDAQDVGERSHHGDTLVLSGSTVRIVELEKELAEAKEEVKAAKSRPPPAPAGSVDPAVAAQYTQEIEQLKEEIRQLKEVCLDSLIFFFFLLFLTNNLSL